MAGRAMPTTVESMAAMDEPSTVTTTTQRPAVEWNCRPGEAAEEWGQDDGGVPGGKAGDGVVTRPDGRGRQRPTRDGHRPGPRRGHRGPGPGRPRGRPAGRAVRGAGGSTRPRR